MRAKDCQFIFGHAVIIITIALCLLIIIAVGQIMFNRFSGQMPSLEIRDLNNIKNYFTSKIVIISQIDNLQRYFASINGKLYYSGYCEDRTNINTDNQVWFFSRNEAERAGYQFSKTCR